MHLHNHVAIEGHAFYQLPAAARIAASEVLLGRKEYLQVLQAEAADYSMVDPTWNGGISGCRRVIDMA